MSPAPARIVVRVVADASAAPPHAVRAVTARLGAVPAPRACGRA